MADDDSAVDADSGDHSPDMSPMTDEGHGYDAFFFVAAILVAIGFVVALYYFKG